MSQVIVTNDNLKEKRTQSSEQEHQIDRDAVVMRWRLSSVTGKSPVLAVIGLLFLPVALFWGFLLLLIGLVVAVIRLAFAFMGTIWPRRPT